MAGANGQTAAGATAGGSVVVVGGGLAGALAAVAARDAGARVRLVRRAWGSTALSHGCIDVAPSPLQRRAEETPQRPAAAELPDAARLSGILGALRNERARPRSIAECLLVLSQRPDHPYARVGERIDALGVALERLRTGCPELDLGTFDPRAPNLLLPTDSGTVREAALCLGSLRAGDLRRLAGSKRVGLAEFIALPGLPASMAAELLNDAATANGVTELPSFVPVRIGYFRRHADAFASPHAAAALLDDDDALERFARAVAESVKPLGLDTLLLPPILGTARASAHAKRLSELIGCAVGETVAGIDSVPGRRLQTALDAWLGREGIHVLQAHAIAAEGDRGGRVKALTLQPAAPSGVSQTATMPVRVDGDAFVLASGRYVGGGLAGSSGVLRESLFGLPAWDGGAPIELLDPLRQTRRDPAERQQLFRAGLATDDALRPLDADGALAHPNLFAAGAILGGHDPAADRCGLGVAAVTGWLAGAAAAALAAESRVHPAGAGQAAAGAHAPAASA